MWSDFELGSSPNLRRDAKLNAPAVMLSTSFKCSPISFPRRHCSSSATRPRHSARQASAALSLMRLSPATKHQPRPLIQRRVVTYKMVPGILCARTGQKTTVLVPCV
jgi:hypothetical protein